MSLINDMLKDLERPRKRAFVGDNILLDLKSNLTYEIKKNRNTYVLMIGLFALLLVLTTIMFIKHNTRKSGLANAASTHPVAPVSISPIVHKVSSLTGVTLHMQHEMTYLRFLLNQETLYRVNSDAAKNQYTLILENTQLLSELPKVDYDGSGIQHITALKDENNNLKIVLQLSPGADVLRLEMSANSKSPELLLDLNYKAPVAEMSESTSIEKWNPSGVKRPVLEGAAEEKYHLAYQAYTDGQLDIAMKSLKDVLVAMPAHDQARELLAKILIKQNHLAQAAIVIDPVLQQIPVNPIFTELKAKILLAEGKVNSAISLLEKSAPSMDSHPNYYGFMAALYERQGQANLAASIYKQLLAKQPRNANWWIGLGVSSEALGNNNDALEAYNNADSIGTLSPELRSYVDNKLRVG